MLPAVLRASVPIPTSFFFRGGVDVFNTAVPNFWRFAVVVGCRSVSPTHVRLQAVGHSPVEVQTPTRTGYPSPSPCFSDKEKRDAQTSLSIWPKKNLTDKVWGKPCCHCAVERVLRLIQLPIENKFTSTIVLDNECTIFAKRRDKPPSQLISLSCLIT